MSVYKCFDVRYLRHVVRSCTVWARIFFQRRFCPCHTVVTAVFDTGEVEMKVGRIFRLLDLITLLRGRRSYDAGELAEELEVSRRTIFRDLNVLEMEKVPY